MALERPALLTWGQPSIPRSGNGKVISMAQFSVGDRVRLRKGGPELVVDCWNTSLGQYVCSFGDTKKDGKKTSYYFETSLKRIMDAPGSATEALDLCKRVELMDAKSKTFGRKGMPHH